MGLKEDLERDFVASKLENSFAQQLETQFQEAQRGSNVIEPPGIIENIKGGATQLGTDIMSVIKNPWSIAEATTQLLSATPAFMSGSLRAIQEGAKTLVAGGDLEDIWDNMVGGFEDYYTKTTDIIPEYTPRDEKGAKAVTDIYMTPFRATSSLAESMAKKVEKENPNLAAALRMSGTIAGFAAQGGMHRAMKPGSTKPTFPKELLEEDIPLDTSFAKKLIKDEINLERVKVPGRPLGRLSMVEESLKAERTPERVQQAAETFTKLDPWETASPAERSAWVMENAFNENVTPQARQALLDRMGKLQAASRPEFIKLAEDQAKAREVMRQAEMVGDKVGPSTPRSQLPENQKPYIDKMVPNKPSAAPIPTTDKVFHATPDKVREYKGFILEESELEKAINKRRVADIFRDINTALGERGSVTGKLTLEQQYARKRLLKDLDVLKKNAANTGKSLKDYLVDLGADPVVVESLLSKEISTNKPSKGSNVITPAEKEAGLHYEDIVDAMEKDQGMLPSGMRYAGTLINSPDIVFNRAGKVGRNIYKMYEKQEAKGNAFEFNRGKEADKITIKQGIKEGSASDTKIAKALDGELDISSLTSKEKNAYDWFRNEYMNLLDKFAFKRASSPQIYSEIMKQTKDKKMDRNWFNSLTQSDQEIASLLNRRVTNYLPHVFDQRMLRRSFQDELKLELNSPTPDTVKINRLQKSLDSLNRGEFVLTKDLPKSIRNRFLERRTGRDDYQLSAIKAYRSYLTAMRRKIYDESAIKHAGDLHKQLDPRYRDYNIKYAREWMGMDRTAGDALADAITTAQWARTLGLNPRTALQNLTQQFNTIVEAPKASIKAYGAILKNYSKAKDLFNKSGLANEVPQSLMESAQGLTGKWKDLRKVAGFLHNMTERGNRMHALVTGYIKDGGKLNGIIDKNHMQAGVEMAHKTQFAYGRLGMPMALRNPVGRVALQFSSFPIKQLELMRKWATEDPLKLAMYLGISFGAVKSLKEVLDVDFSNAIGIGPTTVGQAIQMFREISEEDWRGVIREARVAFSEGTGILPSGPGPTATAVPKLITAFGEGRFKSELQKQVTPVVVDRILKAYKAVTNKHEDEDKYPIFSRRGDLMYYLTGRELATTTFGPRTTKESEEYSSYFRDKLLRQDQQRILEDITTAIVNNDIEKADKLITKYGIEPSIDSIYGEILRRNIDSKTRRLMERSDKNLRFYIQETPEDSPYSDY